MRARKLATVAPEESPPPEEVADRWPADEAPLADQSEDSGPIARVCIECGADDCREHDQHARLDAPSRAVHDAVARVRRAAAEHRSAARALRVLVLSEMARGRGDLETKPMPQAEACPRCAVRDAEAAASAVVAPTPATRAASRRTKSDNGQQALPFKVS